MKRATLYVEGQLTVDVFNLKLSGHKMEISVLNLSPSISTILSDCPIEIVKQTSPYSNTSIILYITFSIILAKYLFSTWIPLKC